MLTAASILFGLMMIVVSLPFVVGPQVGKEIQLRFPTQKKKRVSSNTNPVLRAISDLDIDYSAGLINQEDYSITRQQLIVQAAQHYSEGDSVDDDELEMLIKKRKQSLQKQTVCPNCDSTINARDNFCVFCGTKLN